MYTHSRVYTSQHDDYGEIEISSFLDYKTSDDSISETIDDELLEEINKVINDI